MKKLSLTDGEYESMLTILFAAREDAKQNAADDIFRASALEKIDNITKIIRVLLYHHDEADA